MLNTNVNVTSQELNVKEVLLADPSVVMLLMYVSGEFVLICFTIQTLKTDIPWALDYSFWEPQKVI